MRENKEKWMELCEQAANEQDPKKLMELVEQIDALLRTKQERLKKPLESAVPPSSQRDCQPAASGDVMQEPLFFCALAHALSQGAILKEHEGADSIVSLQHRSPFQTRRGFP